jgi:hypothetical protein
MITSLYPLMLLIETFAHISPSSRTKQLEAIASACTEHLNDALALHRQYTHADQAIRGIQLYHTQLLRLHEVLYTCCDLSISEEHNAILRVEELLESVEFLFKKDINPLTPLPQHHEKRIRQYIDLHLEDSLERLRLKQIPQAYLDEVHSAIESLFQRGKIPYLQYHHQQYLVQLIDALRQLAQDERQHKNWPSRFLILMINFNFNHIGFLNRWKEFYEADPAATDNLLRYPQHFSAIPGFAYDPNRSTLLMLMCQYIETESADDKSSSAVPYRFIHSNLNGKELKLWLHLCVKAKVMRSSEKKEAAEEFSKLVKTKEGILLSIHSLTKMDRGSEFPAAVHLRKVLKTMLNELHEKFPELNG